MATKPLMLGVLFAGLLPATPGQAASNLDCIAVGGESGIAALEGLHSAAPGFTSMRCTSRECVAARDVHCALLARDGDLFPNSMVYPPAARRRNRHVNESIQRTFGTTHRGRWPLYCTILASMAAHTTGDPIHDGSTIDNLIYLFILLQPAPPGCGERIKVAFPQIEAVQRQLVDGNAVCLTDPRQCQPVLPPPRRRRHGPGGARPVPPPSGVQSRKMSGAAYPSRSSRHRAGKKSKHACARSSRPSRTSSASSRAQSACRCSTSDAA